MLTHYDSGKPLVLECDASAHGIGAVLSHRCDGGVQPVGFRSRTLTTAEKNYSQLERESLATVFAVTKFRDYLLGRDFTLIISNKPLVGFFHHGRAVPVMAAARIQWWADIPGGHSYRIEYRARTSNANADVVSTLLLLADQKELEEELPEIIASLEHLNDGLVTTKQMVQMTTEDRVLRIVVSYVQRGGPQKLSMEQERLRPYWSHKGELSVHHSLICWRHPVVAPEKAQDAVLKLLHETHQGASAMKVVPRSKFWWPSLDALIVDPSHRFNAGARVHPMPAAKQPVDWPVTDEPWSRLHLDYAGPADGKIMLIVVDAHSKWMEATATTHATKDFAVRQLRELFG